MLVRFRDSFWSSSKNHLKKSRCSRWTNFLSISFELPWIFQRLFRFRSFSQLSFYRIIFKSMFIFYLSPNLLEFIKYQTISTLIHKLQKNILFALQFTQLIKLIQFHCLFFPRTFLHLKRFPFEFKNYLEN